MRSTAGLLRLACASCFWLSGLKDMGATRIPSRTDGSACGHSSEGGAVLRCEKRRAPEAEPWAPSQKQVVESGAALHGFIYALHHSPLSFFLLCSYSAPQPPAPSQFPSKRGAALPCLLACSFLRVASLENEQTTRRVQPLKAPAPFRCVLIRPPCKRTNNKQSSAFQSARFFPLPCSYSIRAVAPAEDDRLTPLLHLRSQWCSFFRSIVVGNNLLVQRTGLQWEETEAPLLLGGPRHPTPHWLGIGLSWACTRAPRASCTGSGLPTRSPRVPAFIIAPLRSSR
jgi:hypothetical protein